MRKIIWLTSLGLVGALAVPLATLACQKSDPKKDVKDKDNDKKDPKIDDKNGKKDENRLIALGEGYSYDRVKKEIVKDGEVIKDWRITAHVDLKKSSGDTEIFGYYLLYISNSPTGVHVDPEIVEEVIAKDHPKRVKLWRKKEKEPQIGDKNEKKDEKEPQIDKDKDPVMPGKDSKDEEPEPVVAKKTELIDLGGGYFYDRTQKQVTDANGKAFESWQIWAEVDEEKSTDTKEYLKGYGLTVNRRRTGVYVDRKIVEEIIAKDHGLPEVRLWKEPENSTNDITEIGGGYRYDHFRKMLLYNRESILDWKIVVTSSDLWLIVKNENTNLQISPELFHQIRETDLHRNKIVLAKSGDLAKYPEKLPADFPKFVGDKRLIAIAHMTYYYKTNHQLYHFPNRQKIKYWNWSSRNDGAWVRWKVGGQDMQIFVPSQEFVKLLREHNYQRKV